MAHDEKAIGLERADLIHIVESGLTHAAGTAGRIKLSGSALYLDNGSNWRKVTTA